MVFESDQYCCVCGDRYVFTNAFEFEPQCECNEDHCFTCEFNNSKRVGKLLTDELKDYALAEGYVVCCGREERLLDDVRSGNCPSYLLNKKARVCNNGTIIISLRDDN